MPRVARPWFRMYVETFTDRKILRLPVAHRWLWTAMLGAARESVKPGDLLVADGVPMTHAELARYADVSVRTIKPALEMMVSLGMVVIDGDVIRLPNFTARQFESDDVTKRTREHRERSKEQDRNVPTNVLRNTPETETEKETDKDSSSVIADAIPDQAREEVEALCQQLADRIEGNGSKRPTITKTWRTACRLMIDKDGRTPGQVSRMIDWCQTDEFWRANILSMPTLREKYDKMRLRAMETAKNQPEPSRATPWTPEPPPYEIADDPAACDRWYRDQAAKHQEKAS